MDLRKYDEFIVESALKDERLKSLYFEIIEQLSSRELDNYRTFTEFKQKDVNYTKNKTYFNRKEFEYNGGITLTIQQDNSLYYLYTYNDIDLRNLIDEDASVGYGEIVGILIKDELESSENKQEFDIRITKSGEDYKLIILEYCEDFQKTPDRRVYNLDKEQVIDMIDYIDKVNAENFGV